MATFADMIWYLQSIGVADVLLPFLLVFTVAFAILQKTKILGREEGTKRFNVIVALALGFAVVVPHVLGTYPPGGDIVNIINSALPQVSVTIIAIIMLMLMVGTFGIKWKAGGTGAGSLIVIASLVIVIYIFGTSAGWFGNGHYPPWLWWLADPGTQSLLVTLLVFGIVIWLITKEDKPEGQDGFMKKYFETVDVDSNN